MIHARADYNRIQDPALNAPSLLGEGSTPIGEDEPVMLFRAQDELMPSVLRFYAMRLQEKGASDAMILAVSLQYHRAVEWQEAHGCKLPDMPEGATDGAAGT